MTVTPPDHRRDLAAATLEVPADPAARESIRVTLPDARAIGGSIAGRVVDLGDYGVTSVHARPYDPRDLDTRGDSPVDDDGRFEVLALEPGRYVVVANSSSGIVAAAEVDVVDGRRQELGLTTGRATLRVRVVSARGAAIPHREFRVATPVGARTGPELGVARYVDAGGVLDLPVPSGLRHLVFVGEDDEEALAIADVTATAGETREVVLIVDDAGG